MSLTVSFVKSPKAATPAVLYVFEERRPGSSAAALDKKCAGFIAASMKKAAKFSGKPGETLVLPLPGKTGFPLAVLLGLGKPADLTPARAEMAGGRLAAALSAAGITEATVLADKVPGLKQLKDFELAAHLAAGARLGGYQFGRYKSRAKDKPAGKNLRLAVSGETQSRAAPVYAAMDKVLDGVYTARDLVNEPPNYLYPAAFADYVRKELSPLGIEVTVLDEKRMEKLGMGAILAVGGGSARPPRMVAMHWKGGKKIGQNKSARIGQATVALVGKGVTFDTGGISIKPAAGMDEMKMDMGGAAAVVGTMKALALRKSKANVVGVIGLAENMPSGSAYRPGDILKSLSGKTIEVLNTDAEGRLVLADVLTYTQRTYKPGTVIDLATLTGAVMVALGYEYCGAFVNDDKLWGRIEKAGADAGETIWRLPLDEEWKKEMESSVADLQNLGHTGRYAGACTAAGFLQHFIDEKVAWAHLDIAGTAWSKKTRPTIPKHATGYGVRLLDRLIADHYEK